MPNNDDPVMRQVLEEKAQGQETRKKVFLKLEKELGRVLVLLKYFYTTSSYN